MLSNMRPVDEREFSRVLAEAHGDDDAARDGGLRLQARHRPADEHGGQRVDQGRLRGVTLYEPSEMVMSARAGTPLAQIEDELAARGQMLAFEPIELAPLTAAAQRDAGTIGGVFATNLSGARRIRVGAARDHLLGVAGGERARRDLQVRRPRDEERHGLRPVPRPRRQLGHARRHERGHVQGRARGRRTTATLDPARPARRDRGRGAVRGDGARRSRCRAPCTCRLPLVGPALARRPADAGPSR